MAKQARIGTEAGGGRDRDKEDEQDGMSVHSPCKAPPSSASSLPKEQSQVELELRLLEALEIYPPVKLRGIHRHFVLYGLMEFLRRRFDVLHIYVLFLPAQVIRENILVTVQFSLLLTLCHRFDRNFSSDEVLQLLDRFYNLEMLKPDDEEMEILNHEEDFSLPESYFVKEEI
ncbi:hypothetical protein Ddye_030871 [Dipteronia dyeriana]|uniref:Uncharacterized protein n=1 Tax=Dipteronia dyeriana TaxID=168575 RepID=A0AAD9TI72_9ROSI|nr:hypothetical protein Ddye_030871 [Dipteronia dyeriana]